MLQLDELRTWQLHWWSAEAGGIFLLPGSDEAAITERYAALIGRSPTGEGDDAWFDQVDRLNADAAGKLADFFNNGSLAPGSYEIENRYRDQAIDGHIQQDSNSDRTIPITPDRRIRIEFSADHRALLRVMNVRTWSSTIEVMHPKRPYGEMTYHYIDMAAALGDIVLRDAAGEPAIPAREIERYDRLHGEMLFAVAAFMQYAEY